MCLSEEVVNKGGGAKAGVPALDHEAKPGHAEKPCCACRIHTVPFHPEWLDEQLQTVPSIVPDDCKETHEHCPSWAAAGER
jgi:hypothetical protein